MSATAVAVIATAALVLQALLLSMTAPQARAAAAVEQLALHTLCLGIDPQEQGDGAPFPLPPHTDHGCCTLCVVPGLAAGPASIVVFAPVWTGSIPLTAAYGHALLLAQPFERSPVNPRAPPA